MNKKSGCLFSGVLVGLAMIMIFTVVLFKNEGIAVNREKALEHIDEAVEISADGAYGANDGDLIILSGEITVEEIIKDEVFSVTAPDGTIKMKKSVSMYQWEEYSETDDSDNTTYRYDKVWSSTLQNSSSFEYELGHENPSALVYSDDLYVAEDVMLGIYYLEDVFTTQLDSYVPYKNMDIKVTDLYYKVTENEIFISADGKTEITSPDIGDYIIEFEIVIAEKVTVVGNKADDVITSYYTKTGNLAEVSYGIKDKAVLKQEKLDENTRRTWAIRIGSLVALMIAVGLLFSPLTKILGKVPLLGNIVNGGIALVGGIIGGAWGVIVIAIGWLYYKPLFAISLIIGAVVIIVLVSRAKKEKTKVEQ